MESVELSKAEWRNEYEQLLRFETLLAEISARFINLPADQIDSVIEESQCLICECLALDLSALWQWSEKLPRLLTLTHLYSPPDGPSRPEQIDAEESFPWTLNKLLQRETLVLTTEDMPPEAARDKESRRFFGIKSSVVLPLSVGGGPLIGVVSFDSLREEREWSNKLVKRLELVAQIFCNALARKESDRTLRQSEARLSLAADSAAIALWELNCTTNLFWVTRKARAILGHDHGENITMEHFEQSVYADDLAHVLQVIKQSLENNEPLSVEYRIHSDDGEIKWIYSTGRPYFKSNGEPDRLRGVSIDITDRKIMEEELQAREACLRDSQKELQHIAGRLISAKEQELSRLSRELHDDLTQRLAVLAIEAGKLELKLGESEVSQDESTMISRIKDGLIKISEDVHRISRQLHPTILDDLGLIRAIESECAAFKQRKNIEILFTKENVPDRFSADIPLCLYRIVQEGLNNITNHSGAKRCEILLRGGDETIHLAIKDKGVGFDPVEVREKTGLGLISMRERVQLINGNFSIDTKPGKGTIIQVCIPLKGEYRHDTTTHTSC